MRRIVRVVGVVALVAWAGLDGSPRSRADDRKKEEEPMELGAFSVSLAVKDLAASRAFYEKLGFQAVGEFGGKNWLILRNGATTIGLFQGMFEKNILTFNPGWSGDAKPLEKFQDVRDIQRTLESRGIKPTTEADESSKGPASLMLKDPDGNQILLDQHVPRPGG
jgi:catechol 2,3-dioxygenase-like lactoylglutathione lyase family enzyme